MSIDPTRSTVEDFALLEQRGTPRALVAAKDAVVTSEAIRPGFTCPRAEFFRDADEGTGE